MGSILAHLVEILAVGLIFALIASASAFADTVCKTVGFHPRASVVQVHDVPDGHMAKACGLQFGPKVGIGNCAGQLQGHPGIWQIYLNKLLTPAQRSDTLAYEMKHLANDQCSDWQR